MKTRILFSDKLHFHKRNFKSLLEVIEKENYEVTFNEQNSDWMALYGDYSSKFSSLRTYCDLIKKLPMSELFSYELRGVNVYEVARAELLAYLIPQKKLFDTELESNKQDLFDYIYTNHHLELCLNMAAAIYWLEFWYEKISLNKTKYSHVFTFSGSNIYAKALVKICQSSVSRCFLTEVSLTGNDYYVEEQLSHIANNSDIKNLAIRKKYISQLFSDDVDYQKEKAKAYNKLTLSNNKNVTHPESKSNECLFDNNQSCVLIIGQVVNDYSVIETDLGKISTISLYKEYITDILKNTNYNIIFKSHPWEEHKTNCDYDITYTEISNFVSEVFCEEEQERVNIVKDFNIGDLFSMSKHVVLLNSQSGIEAAACGIKPVVTGKAFYGKFGFTHDLDKSELLSDVLNNSNGSLSLEEYENFELFLTMYLGEHLYSVHPSGAKKLREEIFKTNHIVKYSQPPKPAKKIEPVKEQGKLQSELEKELTTSLKMKNAVVYLFTDFEKFKTKLNKKLTSA